jgi:hypothetical protein
MEQQPGDNSNQYYRFFPVFVTSLILVAIGLVGLGALFIFTVPTLGPRWLLFFLVTFLFSGIALPVVYYLHKRFPSTPRVTPVILVREALWFGVYVDLILWLQLGKVLNSALAIFIAVGLILIEFLIRMRERSRFSPDKTTHD